MTSWAEPGPTPRIFALQHQRCVIIQPGATPQVLIHQKPQALKGRHSPPKPATPLNLHPTRFLLRFEISNLNLSPRGCVSPQSPARWPKTLQIEQHSWIVSDALQGKPGTHPIQPSRVWTVLPLAYPQPPASLSGSTYRRGPVGLMPSTLGVSGLLPN
jgi:hypothetical protein